MTRILRDNKINNRKYNIVEEEIQKRNKKFQRTIKYFELLHSNS